MGCGNQERGASKFTTRGFCDKEIVLKGCLTVCAPLSYQFQVSTETFTGVTITEAWCLALGLADRPCKRNKTRLEKSCWNCNEWKQVHYNHTHHPNFSNDSLVKSYQDYGIQIGNNTKFTDTESPLWPAPYKKARKSIQPYARATCNSHSIPWTLVTLLFVLCQDIHLLFSQSLHP